MGAAATAGRDAAANGPESTHPPVTRVKIAFLA